MQTSSYGGEREACRIKLTLPRRGGEGWGYPGRTTRRGVADEGPTGCLQVEWQGVRGKLEASKSRGRDEGQTCCLHEGRQGMRDQLAASKRRGRGGGTNWCLPEERQGVRDKMAASRREGEGGGGTRGRHEETTGKGDSTGYWPGQGRQ